MSKKTSESDFSHGGEELPHIINESEKNLIISQILSSIDFKDSKRYHDLLIYLIDESIKNGSIKESTIAHDFFGKDSKFDPTDDPSVRVYISNLRKKLEHYYLTTTDDFAFRIEIPKGQYTVQFAPVKTVEKLKIIRKRPWLYFIPIIVFLIAVILFQFFTQKTDHPVTQAVNPVWYEFLQPNNRPTMIVFGDYLFLFEKGNNPSGGYFLRDPRINSEDDFRNAVKQNPEAMKKFAVANFTFLRPSSTWGLSEVLPLLMTSNNKISLKLASEFKWEDFQTHNIIFIGSFKTLYKFNQLLSDFNIRFNPAPASLNILGEKGDTLKTFIPKNLRGGNYQKEFGVILKQKGPQGNVILYLLGFDEVATLESVKTAVDPNFFDKIKSYSGNKVSSNNLFFEMVIEAEGAEQTGFKSDIKYLSLLSPAQEIKKK